MGNFSHARLKYGFCLFLFLCLILVSTFLKGMDLSAFAFVYFGVGQGSLCSFNKAKFNHFPWNDNFFLKKLCSVTIKG